MVVNQLVHQLKRGTVISKQIVKQNDLICVTGQGVFCCCLLVCFCSSECLGYLESMSASSLSALGFKTGCCLGMMLCNFSKPTAVASFKGQLACAVFVYSTSLYLCAVSLFADLHALIAELSSSLLQKFSPERW